MAEQVPEYVRKAALTMAREAHGDDVEPGSDLHWGYMDVAGAVLAAYDSPLREALEAITKRYVDLADSGDCGFWNPEEEPEVIAARAALALAQPQDDPETNVNRG